jgi:putative transposase
MSISPNTLYYKPVDWKAKDAPVLRMIQAFLEKLPASGVPSVTYHLKKVMVINKKRIEKDHNVMSENGLINTKKRNKKAKTTDSEHKFHKYTNLTKGIKTTNLNQIIVGDVTAYDVRGVNHYLALLMDLHTREIVGAAISDKNDTHLVLGALDEAKKNRKSLKGCIHHTDADVRYCSDRYVERLMAYGMQISMCVGNVYENAHAESLNKTIKAGEINMSDYDSKEESGASIFGYVNKYNTLKPHSAHNGMSPAEFAAFISKNKKK